MLGGLKRLRGVLGTAATWAAGWFGLGAVGWGLGLFPEGLAFAIPTAGVLATVGAIAGAGFAVVLGFTDRRRTLDELTLPRIAAWGAIGGILIGVPMSIGMGPLGYIGLSSFLAILGAGSAAGSLALARVADDRVTIEKGDEAMQVQSGG
jgi:hypothetical protein